VTADVRRASHERATWWPAYIGLGSNLDSPADRVRGAFDAIAAWPHTRLVLRSALYRTPPFGPVEQPDFVNAVAGTLTALDAPQLLRELKLLEAALGRAAPVVRWGPRRIDLDLLVHGATRIASDTLTVPHPGIAERAFVLRPLADIAPALEVPGLGRVATLLARPGPGAQLERLDA
jgi:2-amino-4-hydroxy-6-hydroxymethyldihydropteridine diphosphokinase